MLRLQKLLVLLTLLGVSVTFGEETKMERIFGGQATSTQAYPFMVSIKANANPYSHNCGGTIINVNTVLTAAHCAPFEMLVAGAIYKNDEAFVHYVKWIKTHEEFHSVMNDIAIARINDEFMFGPTVMPVELSSITFIPPGTVAVMVGWGGTSAGSTGSGERNYPLQVGTTQVISEDECSQYVNPVGLRICVSDVFARQSVCHGDSGGPLLVDNQQVGITSLVYPCGSGLPAIFTQVGHYWDWISYYADAE